MATETLDFLTAKSGKASAQPELLLSGVLHLMSHYTTASREANGRMKLAAVIERHLEALAELPDLSPVLRATCRQLSEQWADIVAHTMPPSRKQNLFSRLVSSPRVG